MNIKFEIFNLGSSRVVELRYLISLIEKELNTKAKLIQLLNQQGDMSVTYADITKAKKLLNYSPKIMIEEGINRFIKWFLKGAFHKI